MNWQKSLLCAIVTESLLAGLKLILKRRVEKAAMALCFLKVLKK
jgi:hypothetical protein